MRDVYVAGTCLVQDKKLVYEDFESIRRELSDCMGRSAFWRDAGAASAVKN